VTTVQTTACRWTVYKRLKAQTGSGQEQLALVERSDSAAYPKFRVLIYARTGDDRRVQMAVHAPFDSFASVCRWLADQNDGEWSIV